MLVRPLSPDDAPAYAALRLEGLLAEPRAFGRSAEEFRAEPPEAIAERLRPGAAFTLGAFDDVGALVGIATFAREGGLKTRHKANVYGVYVTAAAQGRGVARALLEELVTRARAVPGVEQLHLAVSVSQAPARRLYERLGFVEYGREPRALKVNGEYVDEALMVLML